MKYTLITGSASGLGKEFAYLYAKDKENLILVDQNALALDNLKKELNQKYKYNSKALSELNIIYAIQKFNEATRYAADFNEVNFLDDEVKKIVKIANH